MNDETKGPGVEPAGGQEQHSDGNLIIRYKRQGSEYIRVAKCPKCGAYLDEGEKGLYLKCPYGCGEWWPDEDKTKEQFARAARLAMREDIRLGGAIKKGGGSKSGRRRKKVVKKKAAPWQIE